MSSLPPLKYPYDPKGNSQANLVSGEPHSLAGLKIPAAFTMEYGDFFTDSVKLVNSLTGLPLTKDQYVLTQLNIDATERTGLSVCSVIVITDKTLPPSTTILATAQMLGGDQSASINAIQQLIDSLNLDNRPVQWNDILGKPPKFPPTPHWHDIGDVYGFEYIVAALERITQAIYVGDNAQLAAIYQYIDHQVTGIRGDISLLQANLTAHLADTSNPHHTNKDQVGLGLVNNFGWSNTGDAQAGNSVTGYMNPALTKAAIDAQVGNALRAHLADLGNPHQVTAAQVNLGNVPNVGYASQADAQNGVGMNFMTPALTALAIGTQALGPLNAHLNDTGNPHHVTAAQVNLGNVSNFATATNQDGVTGTSNILFMTPATTTAAITAQVGNTLIQHINDKNNPHGTTAAQVGAYSTAQVDNAVNSLQNQINNLSNTKQNNLGFTPVRQGGGPQQLGNTIYIGHSASGPRVAVDGTDFGPISFFGHHHAIGDVDGLQAWLNDRPTRAEVQQMIANSTGGSFSASGAQEGGWGQAGRMIFQWGVVNAGGTSAYRLVSFPVTFPNTCVNFCTQIIDSQGVKSVENLLVQNAGDRRSGMNVHNAAVEGVYMWMATGY